jgi:hypothetical protein
VCSEIRNKWTSVWSFSLFPTEGGNGTAVHIYINAWIRQATLQGTDISVIRAARYWTTIELHQYLIWDDIHVYINARKRYNLPSTVN